MPLLGLDELPDPGTRQVEVDGEEIILVQWFGQVFAYRNRCPHLGWPLNMEPDRFFDAEQRYLQCSNHMALFEVENGACIAGPCAGQSLERLPVQVRDGTIGLPNPDN